ncbi:cyclopropane-fatty-acyl-phospholipid synthase [Mycobacterium sp. 1245111.1]|uniref:SAM-dependent methyltransferase n=1 Tax=Mycobacterium sp. 1245111.1 TaxID=1834073 RepID=UPI0007FF20C0|nr:cyclopropane-fatty-acyl-phospholipid synthase family protein [Mycobacterium sp. 1245111.1]OBK35664.1 cyclopropane-fatty-acyl-phospholipid synthase [Mycobacterium sp. 1245111.1]
MNTAEVLEPLVRAVLGSQAPIAVRGWDGSHAGPPDASWLLTFTRRRGIRRLLWAPNELGFARAYVSGDIEFHGDLLQFLLILDESSDPALGPGVRVDGITRTELLKAVIRLGAVGLPPAAPPEEVRSCTGRRHSRRGDAAAIQHHYDIGNDFYRLLLDESMTYSCGYWDDASDNLDEAQYRKCDLVARKLGLASGMRVLDVGCGWGTFAAHVASNYDVTVVGVTVSPEQAAYARRRMLALGLDHQVEIRVQDYRDVNDGPYDAIASIGMAEHVGAEKLPGYAHKLHTLLAPTGRLLNHAISRRPGPSPTSSKTSFINRYVFPDGELEPLAVMIDALESAGLEVRDVESLREHYGRTLRAWLNNLEANWDTMIENSSPGRVRVWRLYMAGCALAFDANRIGVNQVLAVKPTTRGVSGMPSNRQSFILPSATTMTS